ncbi:MAG: response regulator [Planctomycetaceae bacterium]|nr:response regulator [Planctomycetaceae bacterium]
MKKILLVDDSRAVRAFMRKVASSLGFETTEAENGEQALGIVRAMKRVDAVLLDWNMPVMDGLSFLKALRREPLETQPAVVMCTTENEMPRIVEAMSAGANEYIMKPFTEEIVREKLEGVGVL